MDKESKSGLAGLSGSGLLAVLVFVAGTLFLREVPLEGTRPAANEPRLVQHFDEQDVDARLWQDPLGAVERAREARASKHTLAEIEADDKTRTPARLADSIRTRTGTGQQVVVLAVMLGGGPYAEQVESRRRVRYAVLAGLNASRFSPVDTEHLGYILAPRAARGMRELPHTVPYEWFEPALGERSATPKGTEDNRRVLLLWLDSDAFSARPLARLSLLAAALDPPAQTGEVARNPSLRWRVLGPVGSDGLKTMFDEARRHHGTDPLDGLSLRIYSQGATVPDRVLMDSLAAGSPARAKELPTDRSNGPPKDLSAFFRDRGVDLVRSIGDDARLANTLVNELERRGLKPGSIAGTADNPRNPNYADLCRSRPRPAGAPSTVAVVGEWDTLYGRNLRREFMASYGEEKGFCVEAFSYVRGLDGQMPDRGGAAANTAKPNTADKPATRRDDGTSIERAEGQGQFDYLRRVAAQMRARDRDLRLNGSSRSGIRAIGVLGNDVHDKLLVLRALQPEFPNAIFFTTDLDARLLHPREQPWTRNLIVASNFGLRLNDEIQRGAPPFRDGYQTSAFLSTRLAVEADPRNLRQDHLDRWLAFPRLFEIGRTGAFDFSVPASATASRPAPASTPSPASDALLASIGPIGDALPHIRPASVVPPPVPSCRGKDWPATCRDIYPPGSPMYPMAPATTRFAIFSLLVLMLWVPAVAVSPAVRASWMGFVLRGRRAPGRVRRWAGLVAALVGVQVGLPLLLTALWEPFAKWLTSNDEPLTLTEGISLWPTEAIRLFTLLLCIYLIARGWANLSKGLDKIISDFCLVKSRRRLILEQRATDRRLKWWQSLGNMFAMRFTDDRLERSVGVRGLTPGTVNFWKRYIVQNRLKSRAARTSVCVLLMVLLSLLLLIAFGEPEFVPQRGAHSHAVHAALALCTVLAIYALIFFVVDATVFCVSFVRHLRLNSHSWPQATLDAFAQRLDIPRDLLDHWIDLEFIRERTSCVSQLVYYPFIVLSLTLLSRNATFDDWNMPLGSMASVAVCVLIVLGCALALRHMAEASRKLALKAVDDALMRAHGERAKAAGQPPVNQLALLRQRIVELRDGAFAPYSQQPLLKAVLLPFAALGGGTLLDYMALANL